MLRTSLLLPQSQKQHPLKALELETPKPVGIYQLLFASKSSLPCPWTHVKGKPGRSSAAFILCPHHPGLCPLRGYYG